LTDIKLHPWPPATERADWWAAAEGSDRRNAPTMGGKSATIRTSAPMVSAPVLARMLPTWLRTVFAGCDELRCAPTCPLDCLEHRRR
jgi:hypothetical protein